jgi:isochorismate hydrolase
MSHPLQPLRPDRAGLLVIDVQDRLLAAMPSSAGEAVVKNTVVLVEAASRLGLPIVVTEQYPKGLGRTVAAIEAAVGAASAAGGTVHRAEKLEFSAVSHLGAIARTQWIVTGMETHVCVMQSVRDLCAAGAEVHVVADAVASRTKANWRIGTEQCRGAGATITSTETVVFDLLGRAGTDDFKALSKLIK